MHWDRYDTAKYRSDRDFDRFLLSQTRIGAYGKAPKEMQSQEVGLMFDEEEAKRREKELDTNLNVQE